MALPIPNMYTMPNPETFQLVQRFFDAKKHTEQVRDWEFGISEIMSKVWPLFLEFMSGSNINFDFRSIFIHYDLFFMHLPIL